MSRVLRLAGSGDSKVRLQRLNGSGSGYGPTALQVSIGAAEICHSSIRKVS